MNKDKTAALLLKGSKNAFRALHSVLGLDFEKPFGILHHTGKYTVNQITKAATAHGYNADAVLILLTRDNGRNYRDKFAVVTVEKGGKISIDYKPPYQFDLDYFYAKSSFEDVRKSDKAETFIIWQDRQYLKKPVKTPVDLSDRFKLLDFDFCFVQSANKRYVNRLHLQKLNASGQTFDHEIIGRVIYSGTPYAETIDQVIDKSGYLLQARRDSLKRQAAALRAQREKAAFDASDNGGKVTELEKRIAARKAEIVAALQAATTAAELEAVEKSLARWRGFAGVVADFERFREKVDKKGFASVAACTTAYNAILQGLKGGRENVD